ncbi:hypothetical protein [Thermohalobacter berrensis]|uniref:Uncharacterized protein n=1 Tax=Thermohalobacter berrensis TaxID=99594 RepID=A0A419TAG8_9FIRM|nr:hypothetical protein [Thermohalobacter berrensis]RKD34463.1 hypothetical protein BET03_01115 [Thermohalobacter berrensis]
MFGIILMIIGIICITFSVLLFLKEEREQDEKYNEIKKIYKDINDYALIIEEIADKLNDKLDLYLSNNNKTDDSNYKHDYPDNHNNHITNEDYIITNNKDINNVEIDEHDNIYNEIINLMKLGLNKHEIAKKLGKSIREIDIILKLENSKRKK